MRLRLLDFDGSLLHQPLLRDAVASGQAQAIDSRDLGAPLRLWAERGSYQSMRQRLADAEPAPGDGATLTFLGSGDYHHLTPLLLESLRERVTLIHFDNHPDWVRWAPRRHCGSWVNRALELPMVERIVTLGPCSDDLQSPDLKGGNLAALASGRLEIHPWSRVPSRVLSHIGGGEGHCTVGRRLVWRNLCDRDAVRFAGDLAERLPTRAIWITIDKDVLRFADAATNWDQGSMPLDFLLDVLRTLSTQLRVVGVDICGDYAPPAHGHWFKRIEAWRDQPRVAPTDLDSNQRSNRALLHLFNETLH